MSSGVGAGRASSFSGAGRAACSSPANSSSTVLADRGPAGGCCSGAGGFSRPAKALTLAPPSMPEAASRRAEPKTPWNSGVSTPSRCNATLVAYRSWPPWAPSGKASDSPVLRANLPRLDSVASLATPFAASLAAPFMNGLATVDSIPDPPATPPNNAPPAMLAKFLPRYSCAPMACCRACSLGTPCAISSCSTVS